MGGGREARRHDIKKEGNKKDGRSEGRRDGRPDGRREGYKKERHAQDGNDGTNLLTFSLRVSCFCVL